MKQQSRGKLIVNLRRGVQTACFALFLILILASRGQTGQSPSPWSTVFFDLDPLVQLATWLATHSLAGLSWLALITVAMTLVLGRVFCGWICPFGTLNNIAGQLRGRFRRIKPKTEDWSSWQRAKYVVLVVFLAMAVIGVHWLGVLDPFSLLYRSFITAFMPAIDYASEIWADTVYQADPHLGPVHLTAVTEPAYGFLREHVFGPTRQAFQGAAVIMLVFLAALVLNLWKPRFWCRYVCPLGALLGVFSRRPALRLANDGEACVECGRCTKVCPAAAKPGDPGEWLATECFGCWNCVSVCKEEALQFQWASPLKSDGSATVDLSRRATLAAAAGGVAGLLTMRAAPAAQGRTFEPKLVRPPGALAEPDFLQRCIQCGLCMKTCPANALHPTWHEAGIEGVWTPLLVARLGFCEYECNLCGQICPTGAIAPLPLEEKKKTKIGLAFFDTTRCLPYAFQRNCIVCEEHCPVPNKAIYFVERQVQLRDGSTTTLKQPRVDADLCTGCGICEWCCPIEDKPGVRITSANETRHPANQPILPGAAGGLIEDPYGTEDDSGADPYS